jgi:hypothetical protein
MCQSRRRRIEADNPQKLGKHGAASCPPLPKPRMPRSPCGAPLLQLALMVSALYAAPGKGVTK